MSLNAVQTYTRNVLNGLKCPTLPAAEAWVQPPPEALPAEAPQIFVWGGDLDEQRATLPRSDPAVPGSGGQKRVAHTILVWVMWISDGDVGDEANFPVLLDSVRDTLRRVELRVDLVDAVTGERSVLTDFGERIRQTYATPKAIGQQQMLMNVAQLKVDAHEWINPA